MAMDPLPSPTTAARPGRHDDGGRNDVRPGDDDWIPPDAEDAVDRLRAALSTPTRWTDRVRARWGIGRPVGGGGAPGHAGGEGAIGPPVPGPAGLVGAMAALLLLAGLVVGWVLRGVVAPAATGPAVAEAAAAVGPVPPGGSAAGVAGGTGTSVAATAEPPVGPAVHVAGAVVEPGLYRLAVGARVADAVAAAGGTAPDADADRVNLAAPLADGQRVYVPRIGGPDPPTPVGPDGVAGAAPSAPDGTPGGALLDLNRASATELEALPGIGPTLAAAIVEHRTRHGAFASVEALLDVSGIGAARLEQLRDLVTVGP